VRRVPTRCGPARQRYDHPPQTLLGGYSVPFWEHLPICTSLRAWNGLPKPDNITITPQRAISHVGPPHFGSICQFASRLGRGTECPSLTTSRSPLKGRYQRRPSPFWSICQFAPRLGRGTICSGPDHNKKCNLRLQIIKSDLTELFLLFILYC
jgi:hypothetical protein